MMDFYSPSLLSNVNEPLVWKYEDRKSPYYADPYLVSRLGYREEIKPMGCRCDYCGSFSGNGHTNCKNCGAPLNPKFLVV